MIEFGCSYIFFSCSVCASTSLDSSLRLWDLVSGEKIGFMDVGSVDIWTCAFSPDDKFVISGNHAGKIIMYGVESKKQEQVLDTRGKFALSIAYVSARHFNFSLVHVMLLCLSYCCCTNVDLFLYRAPMANILPVALLMA